MEVVRDELIYYSAVVRKVREGCVCVCVLYLPPFHCVLQDITTAHGEEQCDEDDYGYESNMSQQIFSKLANRYANLPEDDKLKFVRNNKKGTIDDIKVSGDINKVIVVRL